jgi:putative transposase
MKKQKEEKAIRDELIDKMLEQGRTAEDVNVLLKQFTKAVLERALQGEMTEHLGYAKHDPAGNNSGNSRNGASQKTLKGDFGEETPGQRPLTPWR